MFNKYFLKYNLFILFILTGLTLAQSSEPEGEAPESIIQRELFIRNRRAGGPGKILPEDVYTKAMERKKIIVEASKNDNINAVSWVSVNPSGMFYNFDGVNYISGRTNSMAFHPTDPNTFYIGAAGGGVWKTTNGGLNWTVLTDGLSNISSGCIVINPLNPNTLYYGTGELNFSLDSKYGEGIFKSTDAGVSWINISSSSTVGTYVSQIAIDPVNTQTLYAGSNLGLFKSTDGGTSWTKIGTFTYVMSVIVDPTNTQIIFASSGAYNAGAINKSTDGGNSWSTLTTGLPASNKGRIQLAMAPSNHLVIYASIASSLNYALLALSRTTDGGATWNTMNSSTNYLGGQGWYDNSVTVKPTDANAIVAGGLDIYVSTNGGTTLTQVSSWSTTNSNQFSHADIHFLGYNGTVLYCGSDGGVYKSTNNGTNWTDLNRTISTLQYQSADYDPTNVLNFYGGCQDNDKETSTDGGTTWIQRTTGDGGYTIVDPVNPNYIYSQYVNGTLYRSSNYGVSFVSIRPNSSSGGLFYNPFEMASGDHNTIVYAQSDVWKTTTAQTVTSLGPGWTRIATTATVGGNVSAIGISPLSTNKIYIGTDNGRILVTVNNGGSWSASTGFPYVTDFAIDPANDNICYASFGGAGNNQVQKTTNGGTTWNVISTGLPNIAANSLILKTVTNRALVVGMDAGVYYTADEGATWLSYNDGLPNVQIYDLKYHESTGLIMAATHGRGVWTVSDAALPVILAFFNSEVTQNNITLHWATQQEINNNKFEIERYNSESSNWIKVGEVKGSGTTHETKYYSFKDEKLAPGKYSYRLKQYDNNGISEVFNLASIVQVNLPGEFMLSQNYPNPANPSTKIDFNIPMDAKVKLTIYNILGQEVMTLINSDLSAGYYTKKIDFSVLSSGIYFYRLSANAPNAGFDKIMKFAVIK